MEEKIKEMAYRLWEEEGCPHGKDSEHWSMAEVIITTECSKGNVKKAKKKAAPKRKKVVSKKKITPKKKISIKKK